MNVSGGKFKWLAPGVTTERLCPPHWSLLLTAEQSCGGGGGRWLGASSPSLTTLGPAMVGNPL